MHKDYDRYIAACNYPGQLNENAVTENLALYLKALGIDKKIVRLPANWQLENFPSLNKYVNAVLNDFATRVNYKPAQAARGARDAQDARAARDALDALAARGALDAQGTIRRFASWCIQSNTWYWWKFDLSWVVITYLGAKTEEVKAWSMPLFEAYINGAWLLHFTDDTVYWVAKPIIHLEKTAQGANRLHNENYAAMESDIENLYFIHGVLVPAFVVVRPDWITIQHIETEQNAEVRRIMMEKYGYERYMRNCNAVVVDECAADHQIVGLRTARLLVKQVQDDEPIVYVDVLNSTPEPDGTTKRYMLRVDPAAYAGMAAKSCHAAIASTWRTDADSGNLVYQDYQDYYPVFES